MGQGTWTQVCPFRPPPQQLTVDKQCWTVKRFKCLSFENILPISLFSLFMRCAIAVATYDMCVLYCLCKLYENVCLLAEGFSVYSRAAASVFCFFTLFFTFMRTILRCERYDEWQKTETETSMIWPTDRQFLRLRVGWYSSSYSNKTFQRREQLTMMSFCLHLDDNKRFKHIYIQSQHAQPHIRKYWLWCELHNGQTTISAHHIVS